jgi:hypothetical protein
MHRKGIDVAAFNVESLDDQLWRVRSDKYRSYPSPQTSEEGSLAVSPNRLFGKTVGEPFYWDVNEKNGTTDTEIYEQSVYIFHTHQQIQIKNLIKCLGDSLGQIHGATVACPEVETRSWGSE